MVCNKKSLILINSINIFHNNTLNIHLIRFATDSMLDSSIVLFFSSNTESELLEDSFLTLFTQFNLVELFECFNVFAFKNHRGELVKSCGPNRSCAVGNFYRQYKPGNGLINKGPATMTRGVTLCTTLFTLGTRLIKPLSLEAYQTHIRIQRRIHSLILFYVFYLILEPFYSSTVITMILLLILI